MKTEVLEDYALQKKAKKKGGLKKVGIIGAGTMGQDISVIISKQGIDVIFIDLTEKRIDEIFSEISLRLNEIINKWGMTKSEKRAIISRISGSVDYNDISDCDLIIESINTKKAGSSREQRQSVFRKIESVVSRDAVIASNTSTMMISDLAQVLEYPDRAVGLHFITPAISVKIVEVVKGVKTSDKAYEFVVKFAKLIGKKPIIVHESPGNISTRLIATIINEACETLMEGIASTTCIDTTMKNGYGMQFGPFEMADRIGLDKMVKWMENLYEEFGDQKFKPSPILKRLVRSGFYGKTSGSGFYHYENGLATSETITYPEIT
ncbi:MAG: 3-hydroxyacyl-CoA dehydrogenase family protein [Bacteroidales bacterium]|nr:3-hydroxyacyl-CoA dehydrogenase family protein [Bacteroidales bacterium]